MVAQMAHVFSGSTNRGENTICLGRHWPNTTEAGSSLDGTAHKGVRFGLWNRFDVADDGVQGLAGVRDFRFRAGVRHPPSPRFRRIVRRSFSGGGHGIVQGAAPQSKLRLGLFSVQYFCGQTDMLWRPANMENHAGVRLFSEQFV